MSAALPDQPESPSSRMATLNPVISIRTANPKLHRPISGVVGHTFIRLCLWFDLLSSWKKRSYALPVEGLLNFAVPEVEAEVVLHAAAS